MSVMDQEKRELREIDRDLPTGTKIRIRRILEDGSAEILAEPTFEETRSYGDIEGYIFQVIVPKYGGGRYQPSIVSPGRPEILRGIVALADPRRKPEPEKGPEPTQVIDALYARLEQQQATLRATEERDREWQARFERLERTRPVADPLQELERRINDKLERLLAAPPLPPMPPVPPPPREDGTKIVEALGNLVAKLQPPAPPAAPQNSLAETLSLLERMNRPSSFERLLETLGPTLMAQIPNLLQRQPFDQAFQQFQMVQQMLKDAKGSESWRGTLDKFIDKLPPFGDMTEHFRKKQAERHPGALRQLPPGQQPPAPPPAQEAPVQYPLSIAGHLRPLEDAPDGAARLGILMKAIQHLYQAPGWDKVMREQILPTMLQGTDGVITVARAMLKDFEDLGAVSTEASAATLAAVEAQAQDVLDLVRQVAGVAGTEVVAAAAGA